MNETELQTLLICFLASHWNCHSLKALEKPEKRTLNVWVVFDIVHLTWDEINWKINFSITVNMTRLWPMVHIDVDRMHVLGKLRFFFGLFDAHRVCIHHSSPQPKLPTAGFSLVFHSQLIFLWSYTLNGRGGGCRRRTEDKGIYFLV